MVVERCPISCDEVNRELTGLRGRNPRGGHYTLRTVSSRRVFSQTNDEVADALRDLIVDLVPPNQDLLIDAYCGAGFFAKALLNKFKRVVGIDWDKFAIGAAKENATEKETYIAGDVADVEAAVSAANVGELRVGIARHHLMAGYSPPRKVLLEMCRHLPFCRLDY